MDVLNCTRSYALEQLESEFLDKNVINKKIVVHNTISSGRPPTIIRRTSKSVTLLPSISRSFHQKYRHNKSKTIPPTIKENTVWEESDAEKEPKSHSKSLFNSLSESVNSLSAESDEPEITENDSEKGQNYQMKSLFNSFSDSVKSLSGESEELLDIECRENVIVCCTEYIGDSEKKNLILDEFRN